MSNIRVRAATIQKDEGPVLARWLGHYSALFGIHNLTVLDNGSSDPLTLSLLRSAQEKGAWVIYGCMDFNRKGPMVLSSFQAMNADDYDFFLPVDCDEYLAVFTDTGLSVERQDILAELRPHAGESYALKIVSSLWNDPGEDGVYAPYEGFIKSLFCAGGVGAGASLDHGNHVAVSATDKRSVQTRFTYLHHHNRPLADLQAVSIAKRQRIVDENLTDPAPIAYLDWVDRQTPESYADRYAGWLRVRLGRRIEIIAPDGRTEIWNGSAYLEANPDVARLYQMGALHHYLRHGYAEGRPVTAGREMVA